MMIIIIIVMINIIIIITITRPMSGFFLIGGVPPKRVPKGTERGRAPCLSGVRPEFPLGASGCFFIGWAKNHFNNPHFKNSLETKTTS